MLCRSQFLASSNYGLVVMDQAQESGESYVQLHLTTSALLGLMNNANYTALLGFAQGNLTEASTFAQACSQTSSLSSVHRLQPRFATQDVGLSDNSYSMLLDLAGASISAQACS